MAIRRSVVVSLAFALGFSVVAMNLRAELPFIPSEVSNRLTYLDDFSSPYYAHRDFPKLITPQWVGEDGVELVITLGIDDMRKVDKYESYLRPILERLKEIDGRAPVSIMTNSIDPKEPHLKKWLDEGVSIEAHTADHPCPCLKDGDFKKAKDTYDRCVDQIAAIPGNRPVAFRFPCCDSQNTPSPRSFAEIVNSTTPGGNFLQITTSVCTLLTPDDPDLPRDLVLTADGKPRFSRYIPFRSFVNKIDNYPYPFVIGRLCWEFPIAIPDDWQGQHLQKPNNPQTVADIKAMIDATFIKRGTANIVFHPHGWIRSDQIVDVIDHAVERYGRKVKFLNFRECLQRINQHLLAGQPVRDENGDDNGVRILDINNDGYMDVVIGNDELRRIRLWSPDDRRWIEADFPVQIVSRDSNGKNRPTGVRFGVLTPDGMASCVVRNEGTIGVWSFDGEQWREDTDRRIDLAVDGEPVFTIRDGIDQGVRLRDVNGGGLCELIVSNPRQQAIFRWDPKVRNWLRLPFRIPEDISIVNAKGRDAGLRFVDIDEDGHDDVIFSNQSSFALCLFEDWETGWSRQKLSGKRGDAGTIPMIARSGTNNGAWFAARHMWIQNEDTARLPDGVDRRSFAELLGNGPARPKSPTASLDCIELPEGFQAELVAAEPLVQDPVSFDWGPDGRLWVVEMADYPEGMDGKGKPGGRVRCLEDTDGDGKYDKSTLFLDGLNFPTGVMSWRKGVLISAAPDIIYAEDTDGDGAADRQDVLFTGFGLGNEQHRVNGFEWGLDNWVYLANGSSGGSVAATSSKKKIDIRGRDVRIRPDEAMIDAQAGQSQFGRFRDDWGNWFGCDNPNPIFHFVLADHYLGRNPHLVAPSSLRNIREGSRLVHPLARVISHCDKRIRPIGAPTVFTSANSTLLYRDDLFGPEYGDSTFTSEPVYNLVHRRVLEPHSVTFRSKRAVGDESTEFLRSSDPWCRPTKLRIGPDGALYMADMYREVIEHPEWIDDEFEKQIDVRAGHDRGRIYRIAPVGVPRRGIPRLDKLDTTGLVAALASPSGWQRDMVQRLLIWRADTAAVQPLEAVVADSAHPLARLHALCTLDGLSALSEQAVAHALDDDHPGVRRHALRLAEQFLNQDQPSAELTEAIVRLVDDPDPHVQMQLAYTLGEWNDSRAGKQLGSLVKKHSDNRYLIAAIVSSLDSSNIAAALNESLARLQEPPSDLFATQLFGAAAALGDQRTVDRVLATVTEPQGDTFDAWQTVALAAVLDALEQRDGKTFYALDSEVVEMIGPLLRHASRTVANENASPAERLVALRALARRSLARDDDVRNIGRLLAPQQSPELQNAAVDALGRLGSRAASGQLMSDWERHSPTLRSAILEVLFSRESWTGDLLAEIRKGHIPAAHIDAARRQRLLDHNDPRLKKLAKEIFADAVNPDRRRVVENYQRAVSLPADIANGKVVFAKQCAACHRLDGVGHDVGANLAMLHNRSPTALLVAILDPNRAVENKFLQYEILTTDGRILNGVIVDESGNSIAIATQDGKQQTVLRKQIDELRATAKSLMPEGLEKSLSPQDLADVMSFVAGSGETP